MPGVLQLSSRSLEEASNVWKEMEPELTAAATKKFLNKGNSKSEALKKVKRARTAMENRYFRAVAAQDFRSESLKYFAAIRAKQVAAVSEAAAAEHEEVRASALNYE